jgi:hypothetical protein
MDYVDVFISHGQRDTERALALKQRIEDLRLGLSCFVDAEDPVLAQKNVETVADELALADHIRRKLRDCRCLIYVYSAQSVDSRWMPWELGFFDGRWGPRQIGLYDLDHDGTPAGEPRSKGESRKRRVLEYLHIYEELTAANLRDFLQRACSTRALADRADVDVDRVATLLAGLSRDPVNFTLDAWTYLIALQQQFLRRLAGGGAAGIVAPGLQQWQAMWDTAMRAGEGFRGLVQPFAAAMRPPAAMRDTLQDVTAAMREDGKRAIDVSLPARNGGERRG